MMKLVVLCLALLGAKVMAVSFNQVIVEEFKLFKLQYHKKYANPTEEEYRMKIFSENSEQIAVHNQLYYKGLVNFTMGLNQFGDMLHCEISGKMNGLKNVSKAVRRRGATFMAPFHLVTPDKVDWRKEGYVTPVKDQGQCGSCWAFSATGSLEGQNFKKAGELVSLSEQNLVDCSGGEGNLGCGGGLMDRAYQYVQDNGGIDTEQSYPYEAKDDACRYNEATVGATVTGYTDIDEGSEKQLQEAVATVGPVSIGIDANHPSFHFYKEGVYYEPNCSSEELDHGVLAVGYDTDAKDGDYWIVKNSWGEDWGDKGYIKMARNKDNHCGVASMASYPLV